MGKLAFGILLILLIFTAGCATSHPTEKCVTTFEDPDQVSLLYQEQNGTLFVYCVNKNGNWELVARGQRG